MDVTTDRDPRWRAVVERNAAFDGQFYYSVKSTGVYCHPSCAARPAKPENVAFHETPQDAERAGFRPCKRCKPDQGSLHERRLAAVEAACRTIEAAKELLSLEELAQTVGMSPYYFHRTFKALTGITPKAYADAERAKRVQNELAVGDRSVSEALYEAGFNSSGRFYAAAKDRLGMKPRDYKEGGTNARLHVAVAESTLGLVLVAQSEIGVCAILLGEEAEVLVRDLQDRFPRAELVGGDIDFEQIVAKVVGFVENPARGLDLPLDIRGTAFQQRVWEALRRIPVGERASYADVARSLGEPSAVRAVAGACAANSLAVAIPCHRVVRSDGALSGYRWGVERKQELLRRERNR